MLFVLVFVITFGVVLKGVEGVLESMIHALIIYNKYNDMVFIIV